MQQGEREKNGIQHSISASSHNVWLGEEQTCFWLPSTESFWDQFGSTTLQLAILLRTLCTMQNVILIAALFFQTNVRTFVQLMRSCSTTYVDRVPLVQRVLFVSEIFPMAEFSGSTNCLRCIFFIKSLLASSNVSNSHLNKCFSQNWCFEAIAYIFNSILTYKHA